MDAGWPSPEPDDELPPTSEDEYGEVFYLLWPENFPALRHFCDTLTQWRTESNSVRCGMDYTAIRAHLEFTVADDGERRTLYDDLRHMERAAVVEYHNAAQAAFDEAERKNAAQRRD